MRTVEGTSVVALFFGKYVRGSKGRLNGMRAQERVFLANLPVNPSVCFCVSHHIPPEGKTLITHCALVGTLTVVRRFMLLEIALVFKVLITSWALKWLVVIVTFHVTSQSRAVNKRPFTLSTFIGLLPGVNSCVHFEVVRAGEGFIASETYERLLSCVCQIVLFQLGDSRKVLMTCVTLELLV